MFMLKSQDGFFTGELLDGRKGLVPSNFLEKLDGDDLLEFHRTAVLLQVCNVIFRRKSWHQRSV